MPPADSCPLTAHFARAKSWVILAGQLLARDVFLTHGADRMPTCTASLGVRMWLPPSFDLRVGCSTIQWLSKPTTKNGLLASSCVSVLCEAQTDPFRAANSSSLRFH
eukprot:scaffold1953_cov391-Prasinococcus_capsulatus_cf.AAC.8